MVKETRRFLPGGRCRHPLCAAGDRRGSLPGDGHKNARRSGDSDGQKRGAAPSRWGPGGDGGRRAGSLAEVEEALLLVGLALVAQDIVAGVLNGGAAGVLRDGLLGEDDGLALGVGGWEDVTFFTGRALRTASLMWLSHMPHIMPPIFRSISYMGMTSLEWNFASPGFRG